MDATAALTAITSGDMGALIDALDWDQRDDVALPDGSVVRVARKGQTMIRLDPDGDLLMRGRQDMTEEDAREAYDATVRQARELVDYFVTQLQQAVAQMATAGASRSAPDDVSTLLDGTF